MKWYEHTRQAQMVVLVEEITGGSPEKAYSTEDTEGRIYKCPTCKGESLVLTYTLDGARQQWAKAGCTTDKCEVKPYMNATELIQSYWERVSEVALPEDARERRTALLSKIREISDRALEEEESERDQKLWTLRDAAADLRQDLKELSCERDKQDNRIAALGAEVKQLRQDKEKANEKLLAKADERVRDAATITGAVTATVGLIWLEVFTARAYVGGGLLWDFLLFAISLVYGIVFGWTYYLGVFERGTIPYYERVDLDRLGAWAAKAAVVLLAPYLLVRSFVEWQPVYSVIPPGSMERSLLSIVCGLGLLLVYQTWSSRS